MREDKYLIIYVDDSVMAQEMVSDGLKGTDYLVETANDVRDLEKRLLSEVNTLWQVDLFIFDFDMPDLTGAQIASSLDRVYKELKAIPFIIFSGKPREEVLKAIEAAQQSSPTFARNYRGYLEKKGESVGELLEKIQELLPG